MREYNYFFLIETGYSTSIFFYDTLKNLLIVEEHYMKNNDDWFIIEGKIIKKGSDKNGL